MKQVKQQLVNVAMLIGEEGISYMRDSAPEASGHLKKKMEYDVKIVGDKVVLTFTYPSYVKWIEFGSPPHMPPVDKIKEWCIDKGIPKRAAFPIALGIKAKGTRAQPFIRHYFNNRYKKKLRKNLKQGFKMEE